MPRPRCWGVTDEDAELPAEAFGIKTVRQLGENKLFAVAAALVGGERRLEGLLAEVHHGEVD